MAQNSPEGRPIRYGIPLAEFTPAVLDDVLGIYSDIAYGDGHVPPDLKDTDFKSYMFRQTLELINDRSQDAEWRLFSTILGGQSKFFIKRARVKGDTFVYFDFYANAHLDREEIKLDSESRERGFREKVNSYLQKMEVSRELPWPY